MDRRSKSNFRVALVAMPWATVTRPSLSLGLLSAITRDRGYPCDVLYPNVFLAALMGGNSYEYFANTPSLFGIAEHLFAVDLFGRDTLSSDFYLADTTRKVPEWPSMMRQQLPALRDRLLPDLLNTYAEEILRRQPAVVGFTCTFNQVMASAALAKRIKDLAPEVSVVLGGPCVHAEMGICYSRVFQEYVDAVFLGEADTLFPAYLDSLLDGYDISTLRGLAQRGCWTPEEKLFEDLDALPPPDYWDYFGFREELVNEGFSVSPVQSLPFEGSRGCWWGQKHHCTFCGLNNAGMRYRRKSSATITQELITLAKRHGTTTFMAADNILDHQAYKELLPELKKIPTKFSLFFELKTNVRRTDVEMLASSGVSWVQPGIESFSDHVLDLMRKGASALQNLQTLKWLYEFGIETSYNLLVGFPGETDADYTEIISVLTKLHHLPPPGPEAHIVQVQRFAPFHFDAASFGFGDVHGAKFYDYLIPSDIANKDEYAYFFDRVLPLDSPLQRNLERVNHCLTEWCASERRLSLILEPGSASIKTSAKDGEAVHLLDLASAVTLVLCDETAAEKDVIELISKSGIAHREAVIATLERLELEGFLIRSRGRALSLIPFDSPTGVEQINEWLIRSSSGLVTRARNRQPVTSNELVQIWVRNSEFNKSTPKRDV